MTFVQSVPEAEASVKAILRRFPEMARPMTEFTEVVMRTGDTAFTPPERELIAAFTSGVNACTYCFETHRATAEAYGIEPGLFEKLFDDLDAAPIDDRLKPVLRYVRKLTETPTRMVQADADAIFAAGWSERDFHYAIVICGLFNLYNRLLEGYGAKSTEAVRRARGKALAETGYMPVLER